MFNQIFRLQRPLIVFDLETTESDHVRARICSIALRIHWPDKPVQSFKTLVNPQVPIPKEASAIHGITDDMVKHGCAICWRLPEKHPSPDCAEFKATPVFAAIARNLYNGFSNADFAGYNIKGFDLRVMTAEFSRCSLEFDWSQAAILDGFRLWQVLEPRSLTDALKKWCGKEIGNAHDAMIDTVAAEEVVLAQLKACDSFETVKHLHDKCWPRDPNMIDSEFKFLFINGVPCLNFGKNKGRPMSECRDYLGWMAGDKASFSPEVKRICLKALNGELPVQAK